MALAINRDLSKRHLHPLIPLILIFIQTDSGLQHRIIFLKITESITRGR